MANYRLTEDAKQDIKRIYRWGVHQFGEAQADQYFEELFEYFERIADHPKRYPETDIYEGYRRCTTKRDTIYYRIVNGIPEITAIIGQQDVNERL